MANLINSIVSLFPSSKREALKRLLSQKSKMLFVSRRDILEESNLLEPIVSSSTATFFDPLEASSGSAISSKDLNSNLESIYLDINTLYLAMQKLQSEYTKLNGSQQDQVNKLRASLLKVLQQAIIFRFLKENRDYQDLKIVDFITALNESQYKPKAKIDTDTYSLQLDKKQRQLLQSQFRNYKNTKVEIINHGGGFIVQDAAMAPENMLDRIPGTFWAEMIFSDSPINFTYSTSYNSSLEVFGPVAEIVLTLSHQEEINTIKLLPFGTYPIKVLDISYKSSRNDSAWIKIPGFEPSTQQAVKGYIGINFDPIFASIVKISICQESYTSNTYHIPKEYANSSVLFQHIIDSTFRRDISDKGRLGREFGLVATNDKFASYLEAYDDFETDISNKLLEYNEANNYKVLEEVIESLSKILSGIDTSQKDELLQVFSGPINRDQEESLISITKYEYILGIREIELEKVLYNPAGYYSSPSFKVTSTINDIELLVDEEHIEYADSFSDYRKTYVKYEVELGENRSFPILPKNSTGSVGEYIVRDQLLFIDRNTHKARTDFPMQNIQLQIRKNGIYSAQDTYSLSVDNSGYGTITLSGYESYSVYSATYYAQEAATLIDVISSFNSELVSPPERFTNTVKDNKVILSAYPYIEYDIINNTGVFIQDNDDIQEWRYNSPITAYTSGTALFSPKIVNTSGTTLFSGSTIVSFSGADLNTLNTSYFTLPYNYEIKFRDVYEAVPISSLSGGSGCILESIPYITESDALSFGTSYNSSNGSIRSDYIIDSNYNVDGQTFGMNNLIYEPLSVVVNGKEATNRTDYYERTHAAFSSNQTLDENYEYIQRGANIYFNKPINGEILVTYRWMLKYIKLLASLYSLEPVYSSVTPKIKEAKILIKGSDL